NQHLRRPFGVVLRRKLIGPKGVESIAVVHCDVDSVMPGNGEHLTETDRPARAVILFLAEFVLVELPDAAMSLKQLARILTRGYPAAIPTLTGIAWSSNVRI